jgi:hypothetical protein
VNIPAQIRAGDTVAWRDEAARDNLGNAITSSGWTLTYYLRTNTASEGATVVGTSDGEGWQFTIAAGTSAGFDAGQWYWQALATSGAESVVLWPFFGGGPMGKAPTEIAGGDDVL